MICVIRGISIHYEVYGEGTPVLCVHGWGPDSRMMIGCFEPIFSQLHGYRRIYPDLPGFGQTQAPKWIQMHDDMLDILCGFIESVIGCERFLLTGCSYGGYLSLGIIHKMPDRVAGTFLLVAATDSYEVEKKPEDLPKRQMLWQSDALAAEDKTSSLQNYMEMAVIAYPEAYAKWQKDIQPGLEIKNKEFSSRYSTMNYSPMMQKAIRELTFDKPTCILAGRQDDVVGYSLSYKLID